MSKHIQPGRLKELGNTFGSPNRYPSESSNSMNMQFENGALKISSNICPLCNDEFGEFIHHMIEKNHINHQFLTKEFCSALSLNPPLASHTQTLPLTQSSLQTLIYYLKSQKLPLYFKQLFSCHKCLIKHDSIHLLFSHLNKCDFKPPKSELPAHTVPDRLEANNIIIPCTIIPKPQSPKKIDSIDGDINESIRLIKENDFNKHGITIIGKRCIESQPVYTKTVDLNPLTVKKATDGNVKRIEISESSETLIFKSTSIMRSLSPTKDFTHLKNGYSPKQALQSRSNKRLLRNLDKKPEPKKNSEMRAAKRKQKEDSSDTVIVHPANQKKFNKICGSIIKLLKCKFCKRGNFKNEQSLQAHYQNVHRFFPLQPQSESLLSRFTTNDAKRCYHFRCLSCLKMFENFTNLSQHRCKYYFRQIHIPKKHSDKSNGNMNMLKPISSSITKSSETLPDYENESEFFKNFGLMRKHNSTFKCEHVKPKLQNISNKLVHASTILDKSNSSICIQVKSTAKKNNPISFVTRQQNRTNRIASDVGVQTRKSKQNLSEDVIISLVTRPKSSRSIHTRVMEP